MKKILKTAAAALAGMLAFGLVACTDGDGDPVPEVPSYYSDRKAAVDEDVTAVWEFSDAMYFAADSYSSDHMFAESIEIKPSSGTGATLYPTYIKGRYEDKKSVRTSKVNGKSLSNYDGVYYFTLTLEKPSNIQIRGYATASSATDVNFVAITFEDEFLCGRACEGSEDKEGGNYVAIVKGAPAGTYKLYANATKILKIDVNATSTLIKPSAIDGLVFADDGEIKKYETTTYSIFDTLPVPSLKGVDDKKNKFDVAKANWSVIDKSGTDVARVIVDADNNTKILTTAAGTATVRARVGRFIQDFNLTVSGEKATCKIEGGDNTRLKALTGILPLTAKGADKDISKYVTWTSSDPTVATVTDGKVVALKAGTATVSASITVAGETLKDTKEITVVKNDSIVVTLLDTKDKDAKKRFPAQDTWAAYSEWADVFKSVLIDEGKDVTYTKKDDYAKYTISNFVPGANWNVKSVTSNVDDTQYPGILFTQVSAGTAPTGKTPITFDVIIEPLDGKSVTLTDITANFRENKYNIKKVEVKKDSEVIASAEAPADKTKEDKDWRDTRLKVDNPLLVTGVTTLTFSLTSDGVGLGDKFSIGNIKLFFEKES